MAGSPQLYRNFMIEAAKGLALGLTAASAYYVAVSKPDEARIKVKLGLLIQYSICYRLMRNYCGIFSLDESANTKIRILSGTDSP